jgi:hypothetical protein
MSQNTLANFTNYMKTKYGKVSDNVYNSATPLLSRINRTKNFVGEDMKFPVPSGYIGGVGSGSLPTAGTSNAQKASVTTKKVYARVEIARQLMKQASKKEGAFVKALGHLMGKGVESYVRNTSRMIFGLGDGSLGIGNAATDNVSGVGSVADPYVVTLLKADTQNKLANFEIRDLVNIKSETTDLEIVALSETSTKILISLVGSSARLDVIGDTGTPAPFIATDIIYMQGSKDNDIHGLREICDATSGTKYGITIGYRWQSFQKAAGSVAISEDLISECVLGVHKQCGQAPDLIVTSYKQWRKLSDILGDRKRMNLSPRFGSKKLKEVVSHSALAAVSPFSGEIPIVIDRFCEDDRMYFLNTKHIIMHHAPDHGWFDEDGTIFMRKADDDAYEARYGGYKELFIAPPFQGVLTGLS